MVNEGELPGWSGRWLDWAQAHPEWIGVLVGLSIATFFGSLLLLPLLIVRLPVDYFAGPHPPPRTPRHPYVRLALNVVRNVLGAALLAAGLAMLVLPGQGLLTLLGALVLLDFPGKRRFELFLVRRPRILRALNWIRRRSHHEPLQAPASCEDD